VRGALGQIGYYGSAIVELKTGDEVYLRNVGRRIDRLLVSKHYRRLARFYDVDAQVKLCACVDLFHA
jgi:hypothetical protein